jgi:hypothetical protein
LVEKLIEEKNVKILAIMKEISDLKDQLQEKLTKADEKVEEKLKQ